MMGIFEIFIPSDRRHYGVEADIQTAERDDDERAVHLQLNLSGLREPLPDDEIGALEEGLIAWLERVSGRPVFRSPRAVEKGVPTFHNPDRRALRPRTVRPIATVNGAGVTRPRLRSAPSRGPPTSSTARSCRRRPCGGSSS